MYYTKNQHPYPHSQYAIKVNYKVYLISEMVKIANVYLTFTVSESE